MEHLTKEMWFKLDIEPDKVLEDHKISQKSKIYNDLIYLYTDCEKEMQHIIEPRAVFKYLKYLPVKEEPSPKGQEYHIISILTLGSKIDEYLDHLNEKGEYLKYYLANAMSDAYLYDLDNKFQIELIKICKESRLGIVNRLETSSELSFETQKWIYKKLQGDIFGIGMNDQYILHPAKSMCLAFKLKEDCNIYETKHNCRLCMRKDCSMRKISPITITVCSGEGMEELVSDTEESLLSLLREQGIYYSASCAGRGTCGKCKIQVVEGSIEISDADKEWFHDEQLKAGYRLACQAYPVSDCTIVLDSESEKEFEVLTSSEQVKENGKEDIKLETSYYIAIDIGTTTLAGALIGADSQKLLKESTSINHQRTYGGDVISRIQNANEGEADSLRSLIRNDLSKIIKDLLSQKHEMIGRVTKVVIACNTTMVHLLMGYSCESLGRFPFTSNHLKTIEEEYQEVIGDSYLNCKITILPGISVFVGGDITSGLLAADVLHKDETFLLVDLGTNGEMALGNKDHILVTSAAAGPAFEGGNIQCGTGSIPGAIREVTIENKRALYETIGNKKAIGICGTGVIATMAELVRNSLVDDTGMLAEDYENGFPLSLEESPIVFTQKDIRELQLAKSAIRAGIETLILRGEVTKESLDVVYLAGGFGFHLYIEKAIGIGLIPEEFRGKIKILGNGSLKGAMKVAMEPKGIEDCETLIKKSDEIHLSNDPDFNDLYLEHMFFE